MINVQNYIEFKDCMSTLKEASKDDNDKNNIRYMINDTRDVVDFDMVKTKYANKLGLSEEVAKSVDALYDGKNKDVFIEFKNGNMANQKSAVRDKVRNSLLLFGDITGKSISYTRNSAEFVLVYNEEKNTDIKRVKKSSVQNSESRDKIAGAVHRYAKEEFVRFGMEIFKGLFFRDVHTYTVKEFSEYLFKV